MNIQNDTRPLVTNREDQWKIWEMLPFPVREELLRLNDLDAMFKHIIDCLMYFSNNNKKVK